MKRIEKIKKENQQGFSFFLPIYPFVFFFFFCTFTRQNRTHIEIYLFTEEDVVVSVWKWEFTAKIRKYRKKQGWKQTTNK